jgi:type IV pilus assembly protein PilM
MLKLVHKDVIGIDIGSHAVKAVQLSKDRDNWSVTSAAIAEISEKGTSTPSRHETNTVRAIQNCMRIINAKTRLAVLSLGGPEVAVRNFDFPLLPPEEMEKAVLLEAKQVCPFTTTDITVDYNVIPNGRNRTRGYFVASTNKLLKNKMRLAKKARLNCTLMDIEALAMLNCFTETEKPKDNHGTAILNIGNLHTTLAIEGKRGWPFVRNMNYSGKEVIKQIADKNDTSPESVMKIFFGEPQEIPPGIHESLVQTTDKLIGEIHKTVRYYGAQENSFDIERMLLCGGFALFDKFVELLKDGLTIKIELWNPFENMQCQSQILKGVLLKNIVRKNGPAMAIAAGLAMRSIYDA